MSEIEWGRLARQQDQLARHEDQRLHERENHHKLLYKQQLQKMIAEKQQVSKTVQLLQRQQIQEQLKLTTQNSIDHTNNNSQIFQSRLKQQANYNYSVGRERKQRMKSELTEEKSTLREKFKKIDTQMNEEKQKLWKERENNKKRLAQFYEQQMQNCTSRKQMEKLENRKFQQLAQQMEERKEQERNKYIHKIKYGYMQNPESFELIKHIYDIKESQKSAFLNKYAAPAPQSSSLPNNPKQLKTIETSSYNHNLYLEKLNRKKTLHQKQLAEEHLKILTLQQELTEEEQQEKRKKNEQRRILKTQLEHQISQSQENRMKWKRMSENQSRINKNADHQVVLPGLRKDYKDHKQEVIIDSFLKFGRPLPIHSLDLKH